MVKSTSKMFTHTGRYFVVTLIYKICGIWYTKCQSYFTKRTFSHNRWFVDNRIWRNEFPPIVNWTSQHNFKIKISFKNSFKCSFNFTITTKPYLDKRCRWKYHGGYTCKSKERTCCCLSKVGSMYSVAASITQRTTT